MENIKSLESKFVGITMMSTNVLSGFLGRNFNENNLPDEYRFLEEISNDLPDLVASGKVRDVLKELPLVDISVIFKTDPKISDERIMRIYSYFASAYVFGAEGQPQEKLIPKCIAVPLVAIAEKLCRPPILSYASYCLNNWKLNSPEYKEVTCDNTSLIQKFVHCYDEDWFILIHVDIESQGSYAIDAIHDARSKAFIDNDFSTELSSLRDAMIKINKTLRRMPEKCRPDVYYKTVRPYIFGFEDVVYEDCFDNKPQTFRGETGAQSSLIPAIQLALGIRHKSNALTEHLEDMRNYMPQTHRWLLNLLEASVPPYKVNFYHPNSEKLDLRATIIRNGYPNAKQYYNQCVELLMEFRQIHLDYAVEYIHKRVTNHKGTGGTPYLSWLKSLKEETESFLIP